MKVCYIAIGPFFGGPRSSLHSHKADASRAASKMRAQLRKEGYPRLAARVRVEVRNIRDMSHVRIPTGERWSVEL